MNVSISHPTDRPNFSLVFVGSLTLAFSYQTVIGYQEGWSAWRLTENYWGPTTGKHLNWLDERKKDRLEDALFSLGLKTALKSLDTEET